MRGFHTLGLLELPLDSTPWGEMNCWASSLNLYTRLPRDLLGGGADSGIMSFMRALVPYIGVRAEKKKNLSLTMKDIVSSTDPAPAPAPAIAAQQISFNLFKKVVLDNRILLGFLLDQSGGMSLPALPALDR